MDITSVQVGELRNIATKLKDAIVKLEDPALLLKDEEEEPDDEAKGTTDDEPSEGEPSDGVRRKSTKLQQLLNSTGTARAEANLRKTSVAEALAEVTALTTKASESGSDSTSEVGVDGYDSDHFLEFDGRALIANSDEIDTFAVRATVNDLLRGMHAGERVVQASAITKWFTMKAEETQGNLRELEAQEESCNNVQEAADASYYDVMGLLESRDLYTMEHMQKFYKHISAAKPPVRAEEEETVSPEVMNTTPENPDDEVPVDPDALDEGTLKVLESARGTRKTMFQKAMVGKMLDCIAQQQDVLDFFKKKQEFLEQKIATINKATKYVENGLKKDKSGKASGVDFDILTGPNPGTLGSTWSIVNKNLTQVPVLEAGSVELLGSMAKRIRMDAAREMVVTAAGRKRLATSVALQEELCIEKDENSISAMIVEVNRLNEKKLSLEKELQQTQSADVRVKLLQQELVVREKAIARRRNSVVGGFRANEFPGGPPDDYALDAGLGARIGGRKLSVAPQVPVEVEPLQIRSPSPVSEEDEPLDTPTVTFDLSVDMSWASWLQTQSMDTVHNVENICTGVEKDLSALEQMVARLKEVVESTKERVIAERNGEVVAKLDDLELITIRMQVKQERQSLEQLKDQSYELRKDQDTLKAVLKKARVAKQNGDMNLVAQVLTESKKVKGSLQKLSRGRSPGVSTHSGETRAWEEHPGGSQLTVAPKGDSGALGKGNANFTAETSPQSPGIDGLASGACATAGGKGGKSGKGGKPGRSRKGASAAEGDDTVVDQADHADQADAAGERLSPRGELAAITKEIETLEEKEQDLQRQWKEAKLAGRVQGMYPGELQEVEDRQQSAIAALSLAAFADVPTASREDGVSDDVLKGNPNADAALHQPSLTRRRHAVHAPGTDSMKRRNAVDEGNTTVEALRGFAASIDSSFTAHGAGEGFDADAYGDVDGIARGLSQRGFDAQPFRPLSGMERPREMEDQNPDAHPSRPPSHKERLREMEEQNPDAHPRGPLSRKKRLHEIEGTEQQERGHSEGDDAGRTGNNRTNRGGNPGDAAGRTGNNTTNRGGNSGDDAARTGNNKTSPGGQRGDDAVRTGDNETNLGGQRGADGVLHGASEVANSTGMELNGIVSARSGGDTGEGDASSVRRIRRKYSTGPADDLAHEINDGLLHKVVAPIVRTGMATEAACMQQRRRSGSMSDNQSTSSRSNSKPGSSRRSSSRVVTTHVVDKREEQIKALLYYQVEHERLEQQLVDIEERVRQAKVFATNSHSLSYGKDRNAGTGIKLDLQLVPEENRQMRREVARRQRELNEVRQRWHLEKGKHGMTYDPTTAQVESVVKMLLHDPPMRRSALTSLSNSPKGTPDGSFHGRSLDARKSREQTNGMIQSSFGSSWRPSPDERDSSTVFRKSVITPTLAPMEQFENVLRDTFEPFGHSGPRTSMLKAPPVTMTRPMPSFISTEKPPQTIQEQMARRRSIVSSAMQHEGFLPTGREDLAGGRRMSTLVAPFVQPVSSVDTSLAAGHGRRPSALGHSLGARRNLRPAEPRLPHEEAHARDSLADMLPTSKKLSGPLRPGSEQEATTRGSQKRSIGFGDELPFAAAPGHSGNSASATSVAVALLRSQMESITE